jgi:putative mycofactocin binding protein MftB
VFTDLPDFARCERRYAVPPIVRVRRESFGLVFYNTLDSRLTFVKSEDLLQVVAFPTGVELLAASAEPASRAKLRRLLDHLLKKGLIREA